MKFIHVQIFLKWSWFITKYLIIYGTKRIHSLNNNLSFSTNLKRKILLPIKQGILIKYRVHVRESSKSKEMACHLNVFPRKFHPPFSSYLETETVVSKLPTNAKWLKVTKIQSGARGSLHRETRHVL